jgi:hypothetical protein
MDPEHILFVTTFDHGHQKRLPFAVAAETTCKFLGPSRSMRNSLKSLTATHYEYSRHDHDVIVTA